MRLNSIIVITVTLCIFSCKENGNYLNRQPLHKGWEFHQAGLAQWYPATVPGVVHTDLMNNNLLDDPWVGLNEVKAQWVENEVWEYRIFFDVQTSVLEKDEIDLVFDGLDTYADVILNDSLILQVNNMFRSWRINVKDLLKKERNSLLIRFHPPIEINRSRIDTLGYELPASNENVELKVSPFTRKAPYHFGWDWGPRLVTAGIWRPVYLESWNEIRIADVRIIQKNVSNEQVVMEGVVELEATNPITAQINLYDVTKEVQLEKGINSFSIPFTIPNPELWWPNGWGDQKLYRITTSVFQEKELRDSLSQNIGIRTIELIQENDSIGESFYFKVNGEPLFAKGANFIPQSHFLPSVNGNHYKSLLQSARDANMNMIRVWGGGIYENDIFYDLCDEYGILIWQDFMFAGTMYPGNKEFFHNVEEEVIENVKRLRNHPSIAHWNGNNEIEVAWKNWGWQKQFNYSPEDSAKIWHDYLHLFHERIPSLLNGLDNRSYTETSPLSNWGTPENFNYGSMHYWGVWHGKDEFEDYDKNVGRFMSEFGFQSFPDLKTISYYADSSDWDLDSKVMRHHQKSYIGNGLIEKQATKYFGEPDRFRDFVSKSQLTQAKAMQMAIDAHRLNKGHCWGSLFWQLNDCWPGPSWSAIDVFGRKKEFYDELEMLFAPVVVIPKVIEGELVLTLVNDTLDEFDGILEVERLSETGDWLKEDHQVRCGANSKKEIQNISINGLSDVRLVLIQNGNIIFERSHSL